VYAAARPACELARGGRRAVDDRGDLVERHGEHVVQHERQALGRRQRLQHHEQGEADRVGQQRLVLGIEPLRRAHDRVGHVDVERLLAPRAPRAQHVQRHARDDRGQPTTEVVDLARLRAAEADPRLLHGVFGLAERPEHAVGRRPQLGPVLLESLCQPVVLAHSVTSNRRRVSMP
jgi:hypothetical protein